jgi:hypothetical protein
VQQADALEANGGVARASAVRSAYASTLSGTSSITISRMLWTRALPGTVAVLAAFSLPELSLDAGEPGETQLALGQTDGQVTPPVWADLSSVPALALAPSEISTPSYGTRAPLEALAPLTLPAAQGGGRTPDYGAVAPAMIVPETRLETGADLQAERLGEIAPSAPVAQSASFAAPVAPREALARPATNSEAEVARAAPFTEQVPALAAANPPEPAGSDAPPANGSAAPRAFGGVRGSFVALAPLASAASEAALSGDSAMIAAPAMPAGTRGAAPGRRPALAPIPSELPLPPQPSTPQEALAEPRRLALAPVAVAAAVPVAQPPRAAAAAPAVRVAAPAVRPKPLTVPAGAAAPVTSSVAPRAATPAPSAPAKPAAAARLAPRPAASAPAAAATRPATAAAPQRTPAPALAPLPQMKPQQAAPGAGKPGTFQIDVKSQLTTRIDGKTAGKVDFQQTSSGLLVRLGSIVELLGDRYDAGQIARIRSSSASDVYLPLSQLQSQGIPISYDPVYDEFNVGTVDARPKGGRKVHMDQISTPERGIGSTGMDQVRR